MFNIIHRAMMLLASRMESNSNSREEFHALLLLEKELPGIDRRKFLHYTGAIAATLAAPSVVFDLGMNPVKPLILPQALSDDQFLLTELKYIKPNQETFIQIVYADLFRQIMDIATVPALNNIAQQRMSRFEVFGACS